jgi:hypothetical protein
LYFEPDADKFEERRKIIMKKICNFLCVMFSVALVLCGVINVNAQETFTGTVLSYGTGLNTRSVTRSFTLNLKGRTSDTEAQRFLGILQDGGQDDVLSAIKKEDHGNFSVGGQLGRTLNVVRESTVDGKRRIFIVFERWMQFAEVRGGYRSLDYPFGVIELFIDPATGKGEGTYIAAAKIRWKKDKKSGADQVEIEDFATFPARLLGVTQRGKMKM